MRIRLATLGVASLILILLAPPAPVQATPTLLNVRIEGKSETLFEGPLLTEGHEVEASSDTQARPCDGTNNGAHRTPGPTPTAASVDAISLIGETFDGKWYPGYDDYFITRWGPDEQSVAEGAYWGILVDNVFTSVGGCQYELGAGNEVLWVYNAFSDRPFLALFPVAAGYTSGARPLTATAELGKPFEVEVVDYSDQQEDKPPANPERTGSSPYEGADVSPVQTSAEGFEQVETANPETVKTNAQGKASITFTTPGWHRIKATALNVADEEGAVRSNRLDVCVPAQGASGCGEPPAEDRARTPPHTAEEAKRQEEARRREAEAKPEVPPVTTESKETEPEGTDQPPPPPTPATTPSVLTTTPFGGDASTEPIPSTAKQPTIAKRHNQVQMRCVHLHERHAAHRRVRRRCKAIAPPRPKPKRDPRARRRGR